MSELAGFHYHPGFLAGQEARDLLDDLWQQLPWKQYEIHLFGRKVKQPRLSAWCSDPHVTYRYSGLTLQPTPWHEGLEILRGRLQSARDCRFNSVLVNAYRNGNDSMGWHADDEPELGKQPVIASISLGAERRFLVRPKAGGPSSGFNSGHGSLLVMDGNSQVKWQHSVPKTKKEVGLRINLTFRQVFAA